MPIFEYRCVRCGHTFEALAKRDDPSPPCALCAGETDKLMSAHKGVVMKGKAEKMTGGTCCERGVVCDQPKRCCEN